MVKRRSVVGHARASSSTASSKSTSIVSSSRYACRIAYEGTHFAGWQYQTNEVSVASTLEKALMRIGNLPADERAALALVGAGRTDAGVHANGQVAHFTFPQTAMPTNILQKGINALLPTTVRIRNLSEVDDTFHARYGARRKTYTYLIVDGGILPPHYANRAYYRRPSSKRMSLNLDRLTEAASTLVGTHDFASLSNFDPQKADQSTVRTVDRVDVLIRDGAWLWGEREGDGVDDGSPPQRTIELTFEGKSFLNKQVRVMVGALVAAGEGRLTPDMFAQLLLGDLDRTGTNLLGAQTAPACGLTLQRVHYAEGPAWCTL